MTEEAKRISEEISRQHRRPDLRIRTGTNETRLPTKEEMERAGMDPEMYTGKEK